MTTTHTPGPWHVGQTRGKCYVDCGGVPVICVEQYRDGHKANAKLIAAAPELLQACITALDVLSDKYHAEDGPCGKMLAAAIAKALEAGSRLEGL